MTAVADGQFHVDEVVRECSPRPSFLGAHSHVSVLTVMLTRSLTDHRVPLWPPPPGRPTSQPRPPTAHEPDLEREAKRDSERRSRDRELEALPYPPAKNQRLSPARSIVTHPSPYPSAPPPYPPHAHPLSHSGVQAVSGSATVPDYAPPYPPAAPHYQYPYPGSHYPPAGPYDHPSYGPPAHAMPGGMYGGHGAGAYSRAPEQPTQHLRNRQMISCHPCRSRKVKCSGGHPCEACIKIKKTSECEYEKTVRRRGKGKKSLVGESDWHSESQRDDGGRGDGASEEEGAEGERRPSGATTSQATSVASRMSRHSSERNDRNDTAPAAHGDDDGGSPGQARSRNDSQPRGTKRSRSDSRSKPQAASRRVSVQSRRP